MSNILIAYNNNKRDNYIASRILDFALKGDSTDIKGIDSIFKLNSFNLEDYAKVILVGIPLVSNSLGFYLPNLKFFSFNPYYAQSIKSSMQISNYSIVCLGYGKSYAYTHLHQKPTIVDMVVSNLNQYNHCDVNLHGGKVAFDLVKSCTGLEYGSKQKDLLRYGYAVLTQELQFSVESNDDYDGQKRLLIQVPETLPIKLPAYSILSLPQYRLSIALVDEGLDYRASRLLDLDADIVLTAKMSVTNQSVLTYLINNYNPRVITGFNRFLQDYHFQVPKGISKTGYVLLDVNWLTIFQTLHME